MPFCPQCGIDNPANARFCDQCGAVLIPVSTAPVSMAPAAVAPTAPIPVSTVSAAPAISNTSSSVICPQCGTSAIPGEAFCDNCGAPLSAPGQPISSAPAAPTYNAGVPPQPVYPAPQPTSYTPSAPAHSPATAAPAVTQAPVASVTPVVPLPSNRTILAPAKLVVSSANTVLPLPTTAQALIGRGDPVSNVFPDIDLNPYNALDNGVGRRHARLFVQNGQILLEDLDSTNGTLLNNQKLSPRQPTPVRDGDQIVVGKLVLHFHI